MTIPMEELMECLMGYKKDVQRVPLLGFLKESLTEYL